MIFLQQSKEFADQIQPKIKEANGDQVIQLKTNTLTKGVITLESLFYPHNANTDRKKFAVVKEDYTELEVSNGRKIKFGKLVAQKER